MKNEGNAFRFIKHITFNQQTQKHNSDHQYHLPLIYPQLAALFTNKQEFTDFLKIFNEFYKTFISNLNILS